MYADRTIKTFTLAISLLAISCKPMNSVNEQNGVAKKKKSRIDNSNPQDQVYGSKLVYSRDTCSANNTQLFTSSVEIDSSASTVSLIKTMCAGSSAASMGIGEIRKIYRIAIRKIRLLRLVITGWFINIPARMAKLLSNRNCLTVE